MKPEDTDRRLRTVEDMLAIHDVMVEYAIAADSGDAELLRELFVDDAVYELDDLRIDGRDAIVATVLGRGPAGAEMLASAHTVGPAIVRVDGDQAVACGYSRLYVLEEDQSISLRRLSFNRWELVRDRTRWRIARRVVRALGAADGPELVRNILAKRLPEGG